MSNLLWEFDRQARPRQNTGFNLFISDGIYRISNLQGDLSFETNSSGAEIWSKCDSTLSVGEITRALANQYQVDIDVLEEDVHYALSDFRQKGLITISGIDDLTIEPVPDFPNGVGFYENPLILAVDNLLDSQECKHLISISKNLLKPSGIFGHGSLLSARARTSQSAVINPDKDDIANNILLRIANKLSMPLSHAEAFQINHYEVGGEYRPHFDAFDMQNVNKPLMTQKNGQRLTTVLIYLNEVSNGGETTFPKLELSFSPSPGKAIIFNNCQPASTVRHPLSIHQSMPVIQGEKWVANIWFWSAPILGQ